eukprot:774480-Prymnesium_polylepis.1
MQRAAHREDGDAYLGLDERSERHVDVAGVARAQRARQQHDLSRHEGWHLPKRGDQIRGSCSER